MKTLKDYIENVYEKENMANIYNETSNPIGKNQNVYDHFNSFMFSPDRNIFNKLLWRLKFYDETKHLHGDIVECGVYKGSGMMTWLKAMDSYEHHSIKKVVGFDMFNAQDTLNSITDSIDNMMMKQVLERDMKMTDLSLEAVKSRIEGAGFHSDKFELVKGDISFTSNEYLKTRPGFRISILYLDLDIYQPTYDVLMNLHSRVIPGGRIVFDEYAYQSWSESQAADDFNDMYGHDYNTYKIDVKAPTLVMEKHIHPNDAE